MKFASVLAFLVFFLLPGARADEGARSKHHEEMERACKSDKDSFCKGKERRELWKCLSENRDKLSAECKGKLPDFQAMKKRHEAMRKACKADADKLCKGEEHSIWLCLKANKEKLSPECQAAMPRNTHD